MSVTKKNRFLDCYRGITINLLAYKTSASYAISPLNEPWPFLIGRRIGFKQYVSNRTMTQITYDDDSAIVGISDLKFTVFISRIKMAYSFYIKMGVLNDWAILQDIS